MTQNQDSFNEAQKEAVTHGEGPLLVLAGPGSGKTKVITARTLFLIEEKGIPPEHILVITFTKAAALSMQQRFHQLSGRHYPVSFGTFHACFYHILQTSRLFDSYQILNETQKIHLLIPILKKYIAKEDEERLHDLVQDMISAVSSYKNTGNSAEAGLKLSDKYRSFFETMFSEYEQIRKKKKWMDFDDMVYECSRLLERNPQMLSYWQGRYRAILIDEFQDINPMQYKVLKQLTGADTQVFAVGDDDQAIYGFRGSSPDCIRDFLEDYGAEQIILQNNYRSHKAIIRAAFLVIGENKNRILKPMQKACCKSAEGGVKHMAFGNREEQYRYLVERLNDCRGKQCAVLFRTNTYMQAFALRLLREGIPYVMKERESSIYEHFVAQDIMAYMRLAHCGYSRADFLRIMNKPFRGMDREAFYWGKADSGHLEEQLEHLKTMPLHLGVRYICKGIGYEKYLHRLAQEKNAEYQDWCLVCDILIQDASCYETFPQWQCAQKEIKEGREKGKAVPENRITQESKNGRKEPVCLMTAHGAKGLEFDSVWIPDCNEKVYPHGSVMEEKECEEERRLFYVAMTRAKENLELLYLIGTKERPRFPSRFLNPLLISQPVRQTHSCPDTRQKHPQHSHTPHHPQ